MKAFDLVLLHAPSVYDFRCRDDILFAYLSNSDSVHVSPVFEMPPVGMLAIRSYLRRKGYYCEFFNIASRMLKDRNFDVEGFLKQLDCTLFGLDLHWMAHAHGSLAIAELVKKIKPDSRILFGGISATYYHEELISYQQVDFVLRGFNTLGLVEALIDSDLNDARLQLIPNLTWKDRTGNMHINSRKRHPRTYEVAVDWNHVFPSGHGKTPYHLVIPQAGCEYDCCWCGGSRYFYRRYMGINSPAYKSAGLLNRELCSIRVPPECKHTITMIDFWHEYDDLLQAGTRGLHDSGAASVHYSFHRLPAIERARQMCRGPRAIFELSPDSHDLAVAKASGRGSYDMDEMELFIDTLLDDVYKFEIYFMIGLPNQTPESVMETVDYCAHLLRKYESRSVIPFICPMLPFLDPGSLAFDNPREWGYSIFHRTLEDHRRALVQMNWRDRLNYETRWLSRDQLVHISYEAVRRLTELKSEFGLLPQRLGLDIVNLIDETRDLLDQIDAFKTMKNHSQQSVIDQTLLSRIRAYNQRQFSGVRSQQRPVDFGFASNQWFDTDREIDAVLERSLSI